MSTLNASFASPLADAAFAKINAAPAGLVTRIMNNFTPWTVLLTVFLLLVGYDQSMKHPLRHLTLSNGS